MKYLIIGLGSMGKRRIRNLLANNVKPSSIMGFDVRADRCNEAREKYNINIVDKIDDNVISNVSAFIISTPPDMHFEYAKLACINNLHAFIEASVLLEDTKELAEIAKSKNVIIYPSNTMRFFDGPNRIKQLINKNIIGKVYAWQYQSGQYLPDWHPWESISDFYVSKKETGGCREIVPFELVWLTDLFGEVKTICGNKSQLSDISKNIDDIYVANIQHNSGVIGQLMVDVLSRTPIRYIRITGELGSIEWDNSRNQIRYFNVESQCWQEESFTSDIFEGDYINPENPYIKEIAEFINCINSNKQPAYDLEEDVKILRTLTKLEETCFC